jgi:type 1 fimbriae regulatory protein FimB/type 1 fimbriae regulatory protein FimE
MKSTSKKRTSSIVNLTVKRRYLTEREVERLMHYARQYGRYGHRDATMIRVAYRHGLRASELCDLQWQQIELPEGRLHVHRVKNGIPSVHPIRGDEMRALRKLRRDYPTDSHVFISERGGPMSPIGFHRLVQRLGEAAKMPFPIHPHMLRHACGFKLANDGHDTRALQHYLDTSVEMRQYLSDFDAEVHDVRARPAYDALHDPNSYIAGQALAHDLLETRSNGIFYRSVRHSGGECIACFRPRLVLNVRQGAHFEYKWSGNREPEILELTTT